MGYLIEVNNELLALLDEHIAAVTDENGAATGEHAVKDADEFREALLTYVKGKILESYKNGMEAAKRPSQRKVFQPRRAQKETTTKQA